MTEPGTGRDRAWWDDVEADIAAALARHTHGDDDDDNDDGGGALPDPWGDDDETAPSLTSDQEAFLAGIQDQPPVPRLHGADFGPAGEHHEGDAAPPDD